jgi:hypothetical protein
MVTKSKVPLALRIDPVLKAAAEKAATDDRRSLTSLIESLLDQHLKTNGYLPLDRALTKKLKEAQSALDLTTGKKKEGKRK